MSPALQQVAQLVVLACILARKLALLAEKPRGSLPCSVSLGRENILAVLADLANQLFALVQKQLRVGFLKLSINDSVPTVYR